MSGSNEATRPGTGSSLPGKGGDRSSLMEQHVAARARREGSPLGGDEFRAAAEELARIEIAIALMEEPPPAAAPPTSGAARS